MWLKVAIPPNHADCLGGNIWPRCFTNHTFIDTISKTSGIWGLLYINVLQSTSDSFPPFILLLWMQRSTCCTPKSQRECQPLRRLLIGQRKAHLSLQTAEPVRGSERGEGKLLFSLYSLAHILIWFSTDALLPTNLKTFEALLLPFMEIHILIRSQHSRHPRLSLPGTNLLNPRNLQQISFHQSSSRIAIEKIEVILRWLDLSF